MTCNSFNENGYYPCNDRHLAGNQGAEATFSALGMVSVVFFLVILSCVAKWYENRFYTDVLERHRMEQRARRQGGAQPVGNLNQEPNAITGSIFDFLSGRNGRILPDSRSPDAMSSNKQGDLTAKLRKDIFMEHFKSRGKRMEIASSNFESRKPESREGKTDDLVDVELGADDMGAVDGEIMLLDDDETGRKRSVPGCCAICLEPYQEGEIILWSTADQCHHAFHENCIIDYLERKGHIGATEIPCPCCRQDFCSFSDEEKELFSLLPIQ